MQTGDTGTAGRRWGRWIERAIWVALLAFIGYRLWPQVAAAYGVPSENAPAPAFELTTLDGRHVTLQSLRGQVVLVNFWATWCPPCRVEMPGFQKVYERYASQGFTIVGVATDIGGSDKVRHFLSDRGVTYPVAMANGAIVRDFGGVHMLPTSFLIDRQGRIRNQVRGYFASITLDQAVQRLLAEPADSAPIQPAPVQ